MSITPLRLAGALLIAGALGTASVVARVQQTSKPAPAEQPAPKDTPQPKQGQPAPADGQTSGQNGQPAQGQTGQPAEGQASPDQPQRPTFRTDINFVRVDVIVTDKKGEPITDLSQKDFQVWEDGEPQEVESFKLFKIDALTQTTPARPIRSTYDEESEAQRPDVRLFAFFLDDYHVRRGNAMRSRIAMADFVRRQIAPQDMLAIMYPLTSTSDVIMDRNHEAIAHAIEQFDGRKYNYVPRNQFEEQYANYPASIVEQVRNDVSLSALKGLIIKLGGLREGRKALILVSEGYTDYLPPQMRSQNAQLKGGSADPFSGDSMVEQRERFFSQAAMMSRLKDLYELANRNNVSFYALDPRGLAAFEGDIDEGVNGISLTTDKEMLRLTMDSIQVLADNTDGRAIVNSNDLGKGLRQIVRDQSAYYLLGYNSKKAPSDGKFHQIKVKVARPGVDVRHRQGYVAFSQEDLTRALTPTRPDRPKDVDAALASVVSPARNDYIRSWLGMSRGNNGKTRLTFVWEPVPGTSHEEPAKITLTAIGPNGAPYFRGKSPSAGTGSSMSEGMVSVDGPASIPTTAGIKKAQVVTFEVPPGKVQMKVTVEDASSMTLDSDARELTVPDLAAPDVGLSTPAVFRARTGPEAQALAKDANAVPTIAREFRRTERLVIRSTAYGPGTDIPAVSAKLLNRAGDSMQDLPVAPPPASGQVQLDVPLSSLAPGEYLIELKAKGTAGEAKQLVAFRVTS
jgi:VWFA-related protein